MDGPAQPDSSSLLCACRGVEVTPGKGDFYVVRIEAFADPSPPSFSEDDLTQDPTAEIERLINRMRESSEHELLDQVYRRLILHLCGSWLPAMDRGAGQVSTPYRILLLTDPPDCERPRKEHQCGRPTNSTMASTTGRVGTKRQFGTLCGVWTEGWPIPGISQDGGLPSCQPGRLECVAHLTRQGPCLPRSENGPEEDCCRDRGIDAAAALTTSHGPPSRAGSSSMKDYLE